MPEISIIVPVYNVEKYLKKCIDSIISQTYKNIEIILIDDGSTDKSGEICDEYASNDNRIIVVHKENGGLSSARNAGIDMAQGKYLGFVDSDDYIEKDMYETLYKNLVDNDADISVCGIFNCYNGNQYIECSEKTFMLLDPKAALSEVLIGKRFSVPACNKIYNRNLFNDMRYPVGKLSEDAFITPTLISNSKRVVVDTTPKYYYVHRKGSITSSYFKMKDFDVVEAYNINLEMIRSRFPDLENQAMFRHLWSYMYVLDKMILTPNFENSNEYNIVVNKIRSNTLNILKIPFFTKKRKVATLILLFSKSLYAKLCVRHHDINMKLFDESDNVNVD